MRVQRKRLELHNLGLMGVRFGNRMVRRASERAFVGRGQTPTRWFRQIGGVGAKAVGGRLGERGKDVSVVDGTRQGLMAESA